MSERRLESAAQLKARLEARFERGFSTGFKTMWLIIFLLHATVGLMLLGVMAGVITEPAWITQRWPYPVR